MQGEKTTSVIVLPSDLEFGRLLSLRFIGERGPVDKTVVEGDSVSLVISFNKQFFELKNNDFIHKPSIYCTYEIEDESTAYTRTLTYKFPNVSHICTHNYTFSVIARQHPYLNATKREAHHYLNVAKQVHPVLNKFSKTNETVNISADASHIYIQSDSGKTIVLNCSASGLPVPTVTWFFESKPLVMDVEKYDINQKNGTLKILRSHASDTGPYDCVVSNRVGRTQRSFGVKILATTYQRLTRAQKTGIGVTIGIASLLFILLFFLLGYVFKQKIAHRTLKVRFHSTILILSPNSEVK